MPAVSVLGATNMLTTDVNDCTKESPEWDTDRLRPLPQLIAETRTELAKDAAAAIRFMSAINSRARESAPMLISRLQRVDHPLKGWALHMELDRRHVPPVLRAGMPHLTRQHVYLNTLADFHWLAMRHAGHQTLSGRVRGIFRYEVGSEEWHRAALWAYRQYRGATHRIATMLGLTDAQRLMTETLPTKAQLGDRRALRNAMPGMRERWEAHAHAHPDKAGIHTPQQLALRRAELVRTFVLLGRNFTHTARYLSEQRGEPISRQALTRQLDNAATIADAETLVFPPL